MRGSKARPHILASSHDVELAALASSGDRPAFGELVRRHGSAVRHLLRRLGADPDAADAMAQEAFLIAFEQITEFRGEGAFQGWVKRIAARHYAKACRKEARGDLMEAPAELATGTDQPAAPGQGADLDSSLSGLTRAERLCVALCYGGGLSPAEAADALNAPLAAVRSHVRRGLDKLRARLEVGEGLAGSPLHG